MKKLILLPIFLVLLAACGPEASSSAEVSSSASSSSAASSSVVVSSSASSSVASSSSSSSEVIVSSSEASSSEVASSSASSSIEGIVSPVVVNTLFNDGTKQYTLSELTSGNGAVYPPVPDNNTTDASLTTFFTGVSGAFASVTAANKVYTYEDTQAMKMGTGSVVGTFTVNMSAGYAATKVTAVFHAYKLNASTLSITSGALSASKTIAAPGVTIYTTGAESLELLIPSGASSFTLSTAVGGIRIFVYSITVEFTSPV